MANGKVIGITLGIIFLIGMIGTGIFFLYTMSDEGAATGTLVYTGDTEILDIGRLTTEERVFLNTMLIKPGEEEVFVPSSSPLKYETFQIPKDPYLCNAFYEGSSRDGKIYYDLKQDLITENDRIYAVTTSINSDFDGNIYCGAIDCELTPRIDLGYWTPGCNEDIGLGEKTSEFIWKKELEFCFLGVSDPNPFNGIKEFKCNNLCRPNEKICVSKDAHMCLSDGETLTAKRCEAGCYNGECKEIGETCRIGETVENGIHLYTCINDGNAIQKKVIEDRFEVTAETFVQFNTKPVVYQVRIRDVNGVPLTPVVISGMEQVATLTNGNISSSNIEFLGQDLYEVTTEVEGVGEFISQIQFLFLGDVIRSTPITIDVRESKVNIETAEITPVGNLGATETFKVGFVNSLGNKIDPDNIEIRVTYPDGVTEEIITFDEFTRLSVGEYEFEFTFNQIEKYTFDIIADKEGLTRGLAKASVSISGDDELTAGPPIFKYLVPVIVGSIAVFFLLALSVFWLAKRRK